jgi:hypothetical protein
VLRASRLLTVDVPMQHKACNRAAVDVVRLLIGPECKASVNIRDASGCTPLMQAAFADSSECVELLLGARAKIDACDNDKCVCVCIYIYCGVLSRVIELYLYLFSATALHKAAFNNSAAAIASLLRWKVTAVFSLVLFRRHCCVERNSNSRLGQS